MLGSDLLSKLSEDHEVVGMERQEIDITCAGDCRKAIVETAPEIVVNAVAMSQVDECETARERCFAVNAEALRHLAENCRAKKIRIVHFSTDYVFDGTAGRPYKEEDSCHPVNVYGESKLAGERYLQSLSDDCLIVRTSWLYGSKGKNFVQSILEKAQAKHFIRDTMKRAKATADGPSTLSVADDQVGSPTHTKDLAAAVALLIERNARGIFHVNNRGSCTWHQFAVKILHESGYDDIVVKPINSQQLNRPARRPMHCILSLEKFYRATGRITQPWQLALRDYLTNCRT